MADAPTDLAAPIFLLATPQVLDPFFDHSVVLLLHHDEEGSFGFVVNRPTEIELTKILEEMEIPWGGPADAQAFFGGPVQSQTGSVLFAREGGGATETSTEIVPGVLITQHREMLGELAGDPPEDFRLYLGYAGWGAGQLVEEILRNDWMTAPVQTDLLFSTDPGAVWARALESVGVDPATLPSWTSAGDGEAAN